MDFRGVLYGLSLVTMCYIFGACSADNNLIDSESSATKELMNMISIQMKNITMKHNIEIRSLKKELENLRQEIRTAPPGNSRRNERLTLEWAKSALDELRMEMREVEAANNATAWRRDATEEAASARAEAAGASARVNAQESRIETHDAQISEAMLEVKQARDLATAARKECHGLRGEMKLMQLEWKMNFKTLSKKSLQWKSVTSDNLIQETTSANYYSHHRSRHLRLMRKQIQDLVHSHRRISITQETVNGELLNLKRKIESINVTTNHSDDAKMQEIISEQQRTSDVVQNISSNVDNFNKVHISMLELLENMENLENKVDKTIPSFQKEISKIGIDVAQMNSHNAYLKEDQENIRQSVKAIAVGVSNMVDKVDQDRSTLQNLNETVNHLVHQSKQHFYKLADHISKAEANEAQNFTNDPDDMPALMGELQELKDVQEEFEDIVSHLPASCGSVKGPAGNYLIAPGPGAPIQTACKDGWTLVQQRNNGSVDFNRNFKEYAAGFGSPSGEFWVGNEALHRLTTENCTSLRVEMTDIYGKFWQADYTDFNVGPASSGYRLIVSGFSGNASDALEYQNRMEFSTIDKDRDISNTHCAGNYEGGWWFSHCQHANLNGKYTLGLTWFDGSKNEWIAVATSRITLRTKPDCQN